MAARNRPRALAKEDVDAHEEKDLWTKIQTEIKSLASQASKVEALANKIQQEEGRLSDEEGEGGKYTSQASQL